MARIANIRSAAAVALRPVARVRGLVEPRVWVKAGVRTRPSRMRVHLSMSWYGESPRPLWGECETDRTTRVAALGHVMNSPQRGAARERATLKPARATCARVTRSGRPMSNFLHSGTFSSGPTVTARARVRSARPMQEGRRQAHRVLMPGDRATAATCTYRFCASVSAAGSNFARRTSRNAGGGGEGDRPRTVRKVPLITRPPLAPLLMCVA